MGLHTILKLGYAIVVVSLFLMIWASLARAGHPPCGFNSLCTCSKNEPDLGEVFCKDVPLPRIPEQINGSKVFVLRLNNNGLRDIEPYFLQGTGVYKLQISNNLLPDIPDEAFQGLDRSMWELDLQYNQLVGIPSRALRHLQKLRLLDLTGNLISEMSGDSWRGIEGSLQELFLANNQFSTIAPDTFSNLPQLETLDLRGNSLLDVEASAFRLGPPRLHRLLLADNQISSIPYRQLAGLRMLRQLDMSGNRITSMQGPDPGPEAEPDHHWALDTLRLEDNQIQFLPPGAFRHFDVLNKTFLDGNPLTSVQVDAFRDARIRELSLRDCGLTDLSPGAFHGLEGSLQLLDLSANNLTELPQQLFQQFDSLRSVLLHDNLIGSGMKSAEPMMGFQRSLYKLDMSGTEMGVMTLQDLRRFQNIRSLSVSRLPQPHLSSEDFVQFGIDLEELRVVRSNLKTVKNHAFMHARALKRIDFSENSIDTVEPDAFSEIGHSLMSLVLSHGLASSMSSVPHQALSPLVSLQELDLSNNRLRSMPDTSFHFLRRLRHVDLQDNQIDQLHKGTFQGDIHTKLQEVHLSFNSLQTVPTHAFKDLSSLEQLHLDDNNIGHVEWRAFMNLGRLRHLNLRGNKLNSISHEAFQNLPALEELDLAYNSLTLLDLLAVLDQVGTLSPALRLNASHNQLQALDVNSTANSFPGHVSVKVLDLSHNNISHVAKGALRPLESALTHLHLSHNALRNASREIFGNMPQLQWLDLSFNRLGELDFDTFRNTKKLQVLLLSNNDLGDIPAELFRLLPRLRDVQLAHNRLRALPDALFTEGALEHLDASHNSLSRVPAAALGVQAAASLVELDLSWNSIASLQGPDVLARFKSLSRLDLSHNRVVRLDDAGLASLPRLVSLDLSHNGELQLDPRGHSFQGLELSLLDLKLSNVSLGSVPHLPLPRLRHLDLSHNRIAALPTEMALNLTALRQLDLSGNQLTTVPTATHAMARLRRLAIASNPVTALSDTSLLGVAERLHELDICHLPLQYFEAGVLSKMTALRTLHVSTYPGVPGFNLPQLLHASHGLRNLHMQVQEESGLVHEMTGPLPHKVRNLTFSGYKLRSLPDDLLQGVRSPRLHFAVHNTSLEIVQPAVFRHIGWTRNITVDIRNNTLKSLANPSSGEYPGASRKTFLMELQLRDNPWTCDCQLGWVEMWQRKHHQYLEEHGTSDDLREAYCSNKNNASLLEVLKSDIECGWGSDASDVAPRILLTVIGIIVLATL